MIMKKTIFLNLRLYSYKYIIKINILVSMTNMKFRNNGKKETILK